MEAMEIQNRQIPHHWRKTKTSQWEDLRPMVTNRQPIEPTKAERLSKPLRMNRFLQRTESGTETAVDQYVRLLLSLALVFAALLARGQVAVQSLTEFPFDFREGLILIQVGGLLGADFFREHIVQIDFKARKVRLLRSVVSSPV
jgi:hypothetical protein